MSMTLPKRTFRISALLLVVCMISTVMLSGTFAKYTSEFAGQDTALVARWSFVPAAGQDGAEDEITSTTPAGQTLDLFDHAYDTHINQTDTATGNHIIAPGVSGEFVIKMDYLADVDGDILITINETAGNASVPMEFSVDGGTTWVTRANLAEALANEIIANGGVSATESTPSTSGQFAIPKVDDDSVTALSIDQTVIWKWRYAKSEEGSAYGAQTDVQDTTLGKNSNTAGITRTHYGLEVTLKATQIAPTT